MPGADMERSGLEAYGVGIVIDNRDPERKGRIKLHLGGAAGGASAWLPVLVRYAGAGVALGFVRDESRRPPEASARKASDSKAVQTRKHRIEIIEEDGKEEIRAESAGGKMRVVIAKDGGISLANELGDINIKCRNLRMEGEGLAMQAGGAAKLSTEDEFKIKADGKAAVESGKEVKVRGKNVRLHGSRGVCAEGKQVAKEGDRVLGFDVHQMEVPSANGTQIVPLPGTIKFQQNPKKEGEVTGGTSAKVKIDGKEAAVIGSTVTTCNDIGARDNSTVTAAGASMPMPAIINPLNAEEWKREREEAEKKEPQFSSVKWTKTSAEEGEEVELTATVRDIADGNSVTLQVFPEGKGLEDGAAYAKFPVTVRDGAAGARWSYRADRREVPPEQDPRFVFTAHSAWCNFARSNNTLEVKLKRPEITKAEWRDKDGNATGQGLVGEPLKLYAETKDFEDGQGVTLTVRDRQTGEEVFQTGAEVRDGIAEAEWTYHYSGEKLDAKPKYMFEVTGNRCRKAKSPEIEISQKLTIKLPELDNIEKLKADLYRYGTDKTEEISFNSDNEYEKENLVPGKYSIKLKKE